jgi:putative ABC transport system ATP-binding protein
MNKTPIIDCRDLSREYQMGEVTVHAMRSVDLCLNRGEMVVLLGPSGSGKTTTLNLIGGLDRATKGQILFNGQDITRFDDKQLTDYRRDKVGFVFQFFNLIPSLTAAENVEFALALSSQKVDHSSQALVLLEMVGLQERANHFPSQLSGGEQQRVAVARALANQPPLLLCDEPTGNLDVEMGRQVLGVIEDFNRNNEEINPDPKPAASLEW